jgi:hypothetical protein
VLREQRDGSAVAARGGDAGRAEKVASDVDMIDNPVARALEERTAS